MDCMDHQSFSPTAQDHAKNPRNYGPLDEFDGHARVTGPCGDTMEFWLVVNNGRADAATFITDGCGPSLASGSMATCLANGKSIDEILALRQQDIIVALGGLPKESEHCALLAVNTLQAACADYQRHRGHTHADPSHRTDNTCGSCRDSECSTGHDQHDQAKDEGGDRRKLRSRLGRIRHKVVVLSGKGGVGKSTVAVNLAAALALSGKRVGLLDVDIHGPSIPTLLGLEGERIQGDEDGMHPIEVGPLKVMSLGFLLQNPDDAVIWRGPMKIGVIQQFIEDVVWGDLDFLIIDSPPGTGDEPLTICQLIEKLDGAVVVTTPQKVAAVDVRKSITFCRQLQVPVLGVVENMSGFACPKCGEITQILPSGGGQQISETMNVPFLGTIPMDPKIAEACDKGQVFIHHFAESPTAAILRDIIGPIMALDVIDLSNHSLETKEMKGNSLMKIAIPLADGKLAMHFGHCERFALVDIDPSSKKILKREDIQAPPHEPGLLPAWLGERGATVIIAGGMGQRAQGLFAQRKIQVVTGASSETPEDLVNAFLAGTLQTGANICDH